VFNSHFAYLLTILIFAGLALAIECLLGWQKLKMYKVELAVVVVISVILSVLEAPALWLKAWQYNPAHVIHFRPFGAQIETYIFAACTSLAVAWATLALAKNEDSKRAARTTAGSPQPKGS
jgi:lycopene cyclase domain-containing protein